MLCVGECVGLRFGGALWLATAGSEHVRLESDPNASTDSLEQLRNFLHQDIDQAEQSCLKCHDLDNSPDFHHDGAFQQYWNRIRH